MQPLIKILISALLIYGVAELGKRSSLFAALLASLPVTSLLAMVWLYRDTHDVKRIAALSFLLLPPLLLRWQIAFPFALALASGATIAAYFVMLLALRRFGVAF